MFNKKILVLISAISLVFFSSCTKKEDQEENIEISDEVEITIPENEESGGF